VIARLVAGYLSIFAAILAVLSLVAYWYLGTQYHSLLQPALSTPEGAHEFALVMQRVAATIVELDVPLLILVGIAAWVLARISVQPLLQARDRERAFVADAAHELRSPLATIASIAQASRSKVTDSGSAEAFDVIAKAALDASTLIADLLTLARSPQPTLLAREPVDLAAIVHDCALEFGPRAEAASVVLELDVSSAIIQGDARRLRELIRNLLENALRHARGRIVCSCGTQGSDAYLRVSDDGLGVAPEIRGQLFERFVTGSKTGSGLGLAIANWVVRAHEGSLSLEEGTSGATFLARFARVS
jgi:signal transduction histidine kinase